MIAIDTEIQAKDIEAGMIVDIYDGERFAVDVVAVKWGAVQIRNHIGWRGLGQNETVTLRGYFNPDPE